MELDPRTIKELLQLQTMNKSSLLTSNRSAPDQGDVNDFQVLLSALLDQQIARAAGGGAQVPDKKSGAQAALTGSAAIAGTRYIPDRLAESKPTDFEPLIQAASRKYGVESSVVKAVIDAESSFNPNAVSRAGAKGLMQLMDGTGQGLGVTDPFDPQQNVEGGTQYLSNLLMKYNGNYGTALAAYNAGPGRLEKAGINNDSELAARLHLLPGETQQYVRKVMQLKQHYEA